MRNILLTGSMILVCCMLLFNCTSSEIIQPQDQFQLNKVVVLKRVNYEEVRVHHVLKVQDTLLALDVLSNRELQMHVNEVEYIKVRDHLKGLIQGTLLTSAFGGGVGFIGPFLFDPGTNALIGAGLGMVLAPIPSAIIGSRDYYYFVPIFQPDASQQPNSGDHKVEIESYLPQVTIDSVKSPPLAPPLSQIKQERLQLRGTDAYQDHRYQLLAGGYFNPFEARVDAAFQIQLRRYLENPEAFLTFPLAEGESAYISASYCQAAGDKGWSEDASWFGGVASIALGREQLRMAAPTRSLVTYYEFGLALGGKYSSSNDGEGDGGGDGPGLQMSGGIRMQSNALLVETGLSFNTIFGHLVPTLSTGFRF